MKHKGIDISHSESKGLWGSGTALSGRHV